VTAPEVTAESLPVAHLFDYHRNLSYARPRWRGRLHQICFAVSLALAPLLLLGVDGFRQHTAAAIYAASVTGLFGASALYHRGMWSPRAKLWLQRLDQVMILVLIAGSSTPPLLVCLPGRLGPIATLTMWTLTAAAATIRLVWLRAPERLVGAIFLALGWLAGTAAPAVWVSAGVVPAVLLLCGGVLYTIGAVCYHRRRPDPVPAVFGYPEVFHLFVAAAAACQYLAIAAYIL
jgi:hemolysin III